MAPERAVYSRFCSASDAAATLKGLRLKHRAKKISAEFRRRTMVKQRPEEKRPAVLITTS